MRSTIFELKHFATHAQNITSKNSIEKWLKKITEKLYQLPASVLNVNGARTWTFSFYFWLLLHWKPIVWSISNVIWREMWVLLTLSCFLCHFHFYTIAIQFVLSLKWNLIRFEKKAASLSISFNSHSIFTLSYSLCAHFVAHFRDNFSHRRSLYHFDGSTLFIRMSSILKMPTLTLPRVICQLNIASLPSPNANRSISFHSFGQLCKKKFNNTRRKKRRNETRIFATHTNIIRFSVNAFTIDKWQSWTANRPISCQFPFGCVCCLFVRVQFCTCISNGR